MRQTKWKEHNIEKTDEMICQKADEGTTNDLLQCVLLSVFEWTKKCLNNYWD